MTGAVRFNPLDPRFLADPYPEYHRLRREDPVHWSVTGSWILTRYDDVKAILTDPRFRTADTPERVARRGRNFTRSGPNLDDLNRLMRGFFIFSDPPAHERSRAPARNAFGSLSPALLAEYVGRITGGLLASLADRRAADLVAEFAEPLACRTIGQLMGMGDEDAARMQALSHRIARVLDSMVPLERYRDMNEAAREMLAYFDEALARAAGGPGFLQHLKASMPGEEGQMRLAPLAAGIFFAGQETTVNALANSILVLAGNTEARANVLRRARMPPPATAAPEAGWIQELLRFESPVQLTAREALVDVGLRGRVIQAGQRVVLYLGAANRDPAVFPEPDRLDFERPLRGHFAFGAGIHRCLGAHLAAEEMRQGLTGLFKQFPELRLANLAPRWRNNITMRGPAELPATLRPEQ